MCVCVWKMLGGNTFVFVFGHLTTQSFSPITRSTFILSICLEVFPEEKHDQSGALSLSKQTSECKQQCVQCALCIGCIQHINQRGAVKIH